MRTTISISDNIDADLKALAVKEKRSVSSMAAILLEAAIKERNRKKKKDATAPQSHP